MLALREEDGEHPVALAQRRERLREIREILRVRIGEDGQEAALPDGRFQSEGAQRGGCGIDQARSDRQREARRQLLELAATDPVRPLDQIGGADGVREDAKRLQETRLDRVRAIVDLRRLRSGSAAIAFASSDPRLRRDLSAVGSALGRPGESLQLLALPEPRGSLRRRSRIPTIVVASLDPEPAAGAASEVIAADGDEAFRSAARTLAVFLGYLDATLRAREGPAAPAADG